jgi:hypothetical protein
LAFGDPVAAFVDRVVDVAAFADRVVDVAAFADRVVDLVVACLPVEPDCVTFAARPAAAVVRGRLPLPVFGAASALSALRTSAVVSAATAGTVVVSPLAASSGSWTV